MVFENQLQLVDMKSRLYYKNLNFKAIMKFTNLPNPKILKIIRFRNQTRIQTRPTRNEYL
jgi:hypothetical protein